MAKPSTIPSRQLHPLVIAGGVVIALVLAATTMLWAHYGTAVFVETIVAGLATCL